MERRVKVAIEIDDEDRLKCGERCAYLETSHKVFGNEDVSMCLLFTDELKDKMRCFDCIDKEVQ